MPAGPRTLVILPDADRVEHALVDAAAQERFVDGRGFKTLRDVERACDPLRHLGRAACSPPAARLLLAAAARAQKGHPFGDWAHEPSFARAALQLVAELKGQQAGPADLLRAADKLADAAARARGRALAHLWESFEAAKARAGLADREDALVACCQVLEQGLPAALAGFESVEVRHVYDWPPLRLRFLRALARAFERAGVHFEAALPHTGNAQVDALVDEALGLLERGGQDDAPFARTQPPDGDRPLAAVVRQLWAPPPAGRGAPPAPQLEVPALSAFSAPDARAEVDELARRVRDALDRGMPPDEVAVAFPDLGPEAEALVDALGRLGVPARSRRGAPLLSTAPGRLAVDLPLLVDEAWPLERLARTLDGRPGRVLGCPFDPMPLLVRAGVRDDGPAPGGAWVARLEQLARRLEAEARGRPPRDASRVRTLAAAVQALQRTCAPLRAEDTLEGYLRSWSQAVHALGLLDDAAAPEPRDGASDLLERLAVRGLAREQAAVAALRGLVESLPEAVAHAGAGRVRLDLPGFHRWLVDAARDVNLAAWGPRTGAVRILDARELPGRSLQAVFLGGLVDGRLPARPAASPLLAERVKGALNAAAGRPLFRLLAGEGDERRGTRDARDRLVFALALAAPSRLLAVSRARADGDGRPALPSPWLAELERVVAGFHAVPLPRAAVAPLDAARSEGELRTRVALEALSPPSTRLTDPDPLAPLLRERFGAAPWFQAARDAATMEEERFRFFGAEDVPAGPWSGAVRGPDVEGPLQRALAFSKERPLSATALNTWGTCAFKGFLAQLLEVDPLREGGQDLDPRDQGTLQHAVAEALLPRMLEAGLLGADPDRVDLAAVDAVAEAAVAEARTKLEARALPANPLLWGLRCDAARRLARVLALGEHARPFDADPQAVELRFGREGVGLGPVAVPAALEGEQDVWLTGKIDRLDRREGFEGVLDYKSRAPERATLVRELLHSEFQVAVYLHAVRQAHGPVDLDGGWQGFRDGKPRLVSEVLAQKELTLDALLAVDAPTRAALAEDENLANAVHALVARLRGGDFGPRPRSCEHCDYQRVCRISGRKLEERGGED